jgi:hypothetical protein
MNKESKDHSPPEAQPTSGTLQDNPQSRTEQTEQLDQQSRKLFNEVLGCLTRLTDTGYQVVSNAKRYFKLGRVFMTHWAEPKGTSPSSDENAQVDSDHRKVAFSEIRHFVVVRAKAGHCLCVPISTYRGQGTLKHTARPAQDHAIIVAFGDEPQLQPGEPELKKRPLKVICEDPTLKKLHPASRINFGKVYTVEYNIKVRTFGRIATESLPLLQQYFLETNLGTRDAHEDTSKQSRRDTSGSPDQSTHRLGIEPFQASSRQFPADRVVSQSGQLTLTLRSGQERRDDDSATATDAFPRHSVPHMLSGRHAQRLDSRYRALTESSEEPSRASNPDALRAPQSAKSLSLVPAWVPMIGARQAAENGDRFRPLPIDGTLSTLIILYSSLKVFKVISTCSTKMKDTTNLTDRSLRTHDNSTLESDCMNEVCRSAHTGWQDTSMEPSYHHLPAACKGRS